MIPVLPEFNISMRPSWLNWRKLLLLAAIVSVAAMWVMGHRGGYIQNVGVPECPAAGDAS